jgi:hypothetical protein
MGLHRIQHHRLTLNELDQAELPLDDVPLWLGVEGGSATDEHGLTRIGRMGRKEAGRTSDPAHASDSCQFASIRGSHPSLRAEAHLVWKPSSPRGKLRLAAVDRFKIM